MRFLHTSDWHLGRSFHGEGLTAAHELYLDHLVEIAREEKPDAVLVSGDVYDRALPNPLTVALLDDVLVRLMDTGAQVVVTSGNHDSAVRLGFAGRILERQGLHLRTDVGSCTRPIPITSRRQGNLAGYVIAVPYLEPQLCAAALGADEPTHARVLAQAFHAGRDAVTQELTGSGLPGGDIPVVGMAHAFFAGATSSESERDICVGGLGVAPTSALEGLDYAALGHLHGRQTLTERIRYSGSPVPMSFSEANHVKGTWLVEVGGSASVDADFLAAPVYRRLATLRGTLDELLTDRSLAEVESAWCQVTLTDEIRPAEAMDRLRTRFPHTLRLQFETPARTDEPATYTERVRGRSDVELCADFLRHVRGGRGPNASERTTLNRAVASALRMNDEPGTLGTGATLNHETTLHHEALLPIQGLE